MRRGYIYFIRVEYGEQPIKIGFTRHPMSRLDGLQPWSPWLLTVVAVFECDQPKKEERAIHRRLAPARMQGEWFLGDAAQKEITQLSRRLKRVDSDAKDLRDKREHATKITRLRVAPEEHDVYREIALAEGKNMSAWIRDTLNECAAKAESV